MGEPTVVSSLVVGGGGRAGGGGVLYPAWRASYHPAGRKLSRDRPGEEAGTAGGSRA